MPWSTPVSGLPILEIEHTSCALDHQGPVGCSEAKWRKVFFVSCVFHVLEPLYEDRQENGLSRSDRSSHLLRKDRPPAYKTQGSPPAKFDLCEWAKAVNPIASPAEGLSALLGPSSTFK